MKNRLNAEEREILERFERGELAPASEAQREMETARRAARNTFNKTRRVNLRVTERDFNLAHSRSRKPAARRRRRYGRSFSSMDPPATVLVTGATGYIGGRLAPRLLAEGHRVRVLARSAARVRSRSWADQVEVVEGDALDRETLSQALAGVDCAYYLIHSMGSGAGFHALDVDAARFFGSAAQGSRRPAHRLPGRAGGPEGRPVAAPAFPAGHGSGAPGSRRSGDGVPGGGDRGGGEHLVRDDPLSGGAAPGDGLSPVGVLAGSAHRGQRRAGLSRGGAEQHGKRRQDHRDRRPGGDHVQGDDAGLREGPGSQALARAGAGADPAPVVLLGTLDHADPVGGERSAHRGASERGGGDRQSGRGSCSRPSRRGTTARPSGR